MNCDWNLFWMDELKACKSSLSICKAITKGVAVTTLLVLLLLLSNDTSPKIDPTPSVARLTVFGSLRESRPSSVLGVDDFVILTWPAKIITTDLPSSPSEKIVKSFCSYFFTVELFLIISHFSDSENSSKKGTLCLLLETFEVSLAGLLDWSKH